MFNIAEKKPFKILSTVEVSTFYVFILMRQDSQHIVDIICSGS